MKPGYKQTEVGVIPKDWEVKPLKKISPQQSVGLVINPSTYFDKAGTVPMLVGSNIGENKIDWDNAKRITEDSNKNLPASRLYAGDIVMVRVGEPGTTAIIPPEFNGCNCASMMIVRKHSSFDSEWLCFVMNSFLGKTQVAGVQYGTAQKQFNISDTVDFCYPVPSFSEQKAIATALSDIDNLLGVLDRLIAKKQNLKQAAMQELLTGKQRLPGFSGEWEEKIVNNLTPQVTAGGTPSTNKPEYWGGSIRWMNSGELNFKKVTEVEGKITEEGLKNSSTKIVPPNCVLIGLAGQGKTRGTVAINKIKLCTNQSIAAIFPDESFSTEFLYQNLDNRYDELRTISTGDGGRGGLNLTLIKKLTVNLPSLPEQKVIALSQFLTNTIPLGVKLALN